MNSLFPIGKTIITRAAQMSLNPADVQAAMNRHAAGDWGDLDAYDKSANDNAILELERLVSAYHDSAGKKFYIITEHDRSVTTVLLPEDY